MHPARRIIQSKQPAREAAAVTARPAADDLQVAAGMPDAVVPDEVAMPTRKIAELVISGAMAPAALGLDPFYTKSRLAETYPDIVQGDLSSLPGWAISMVRRSGSKEATGRYVFVESLKDSLSQGLFHVAEFVSGRLVCAVDRHDGRIFHDMVSVTETQHALASQMFERVRSFVTDPTQTLLTVTSAAGALRCLEPPAPDVAPRRRRKIG